MYTNDLSQIRLGLINYIGAMLKSAKTIHKDNTEDSAHVVFAILIEEALKVSQINGESVCNSYIVKPLYRAIIFVLEQHMHELIRQKKNNEVIALYAATVSQLKNIISYEKDNIHEKATEV